MVADKIMPRSHWAGLLPVDLHETLESLRFNGEGNSELCNRLILSLIDWIKADRLTAVRQGVLAISLAHVRHPEVLADYLRPALVHSIGEPDSDFEVRGDLREFCYKHPRIVVLGRLPQNRKFLQFKAVDEVDQFLEELDLALPETKTLRIEVALRWAIQAPRSDEWVEPGQFFDWICQTYGLREVSQPECLNSAPPHASRDALIGFLKDLEASGRIDTGWSGGVRSLKVSLGQQVNAYDLRDILASKNHPRYSKIVEPTLRGERVQVLWRSAPIGFLVSELDGRAFESDYSIDLSALSQSEFFKLFSKTAAGLREGTIGGVTIQTRQKDTLMLVSFLKFQPQWAENLVQADTPCTAP